MSSFFKQYAMSLILIVSTTWAFDTIDTLSEQYNLGRLLGGPTVHSYTKGVAYSSKQPGGMVLPRRYQYVDKGSFFDSTESLFHQRLCGYIGREDRYQLGMRFLEFGVSDSLTTAVFLEQLLLTLKPKDGHRLVFDLEQENLYTGMSDDNYSNYTLNFSLDSKWDLLTRSGHISVDDEEYALAYLNEPLLDKKQYRHSLGIYQELAWLGKNIFDFDYNGSLGLHENVELTLGSSLYLGSSIKYSINAVPRVVFRFNNSEINASYTWGKAKYQPYNPLQYQGGDTLGHRYNKWTLQGGHLWNAQREHKSASIESNWDNFYSSILLNGEMYSFIKTDFSTTKDSYTTRGRKERALSLFASHRFGITDNFIAGAAYELFADRLGDVEPSSETLLQANVLIHNLTAGTTTLNSANRKELLFGRILNRHSFICALSGILPLSHNFNGRTRYYNTPRIALYDPYRPDELKEFSHSGKVERSLITEQNSKRNAHYALRTYYGLSEWCMIQGEFLGYFEDEWEDLDCSWGVGGTFHSSQKLYAQLLCEFFSVGDASERGASFSLNLNGLF